MFLPIHDQNGLRFIRHAYVNNLLIVVNILVWLYVRSQSPMQQAVLDTAYGFIPATIFAGAHLEPAIRAIPPWLTFLTYGFFHINFLHIASNMLFLWVFGDNVEDALGHARYFLFYIACSMIGALGHALTGLDSQIPMIGASGAISGVLAAYVILRPNVRVWVLVLFGIPLPLPAFIPLLIWIGEQFYMLATNAVGEVSWGAHTGGILAGAILVIFMRRPQLPLFDRSR